MQTRGNRIVPATFLVVYGVLAALMATPIAEAVAELVLKL